MPGFFMRAGSALRCRPRLSAAPSLHSVVALVFLKAGKTMECRAPQKLQLPGWKLGSDINIHQPFGKDDP